MKILRGLGLSVAVTLMAGNASAWGEPGHQLVGSIAWNILKQPGHANALNHVQTILNQIGKHTLGEATTWADCLRDVSKNGANFVVAYKPKYTPQICTTAFPQNNAAEMAAMTGYAANNWSKCDYTAPGSGACHLTYHFADIPYQHGAYAIGDISVSQHDIVASITEAIYYLRNGHSSPGAVVIFSNQREALFILAHLMGDLHQPLHVGAVYLDASGNVVDPAGNPTLAQQTATHGGNSILESSGASNLHSEWDSIDASLGVNASATFVSDAQAEVTADSGDVAGWPVLWASETITVARDKAFPGLTYSGDGHGQWNFDAPHDYASIRSDTQKQQIERAGVRLAEVLEAIWPG